MENNSLDKEFTQEDQFLRLKAIVAKLRSEDGCPWDKIQTHQSLLPYLFEESNEVFDAIEDKDVNHLREELGDLVLQVFLHAQIESEKGHYQIEDVLHDICDKLIRRHPHVFGEAKADSPTDVLTLWDQVKSKEHNGEKPESLLDKVPKHFPPLTIAYKYQRQASKVGFDWKDYTGSLKKIFEEYNEVQNAINNNDRENLEHEVGDIIFAVVNLARFFDIRCDVALTKANSRFKNRFMHIEQKVKESGKDWSEFSLDELDKLWDEAKQIEKDKKNN